MAEAYSWRINLLGGFRVACGSNVVAEAAWRRRKAAALVKLLALAHGHRLHREQVMEMLWPNQRPDAAANSLYQAIHYARQACSSVHAEGRRCLQLEDEYLSLCPGESLWVDVEAFEAAAHAVREEGQSI